ncbi:putative T7SS-secreted protein [Streptomyces sp. NPDC057543]|uniref:putative T7SS-secreted protein n=1 Tax=Streptomyces sp. NPDC057543 TaxID=3346163 RepID=UPI0036A31229
MGAALGSTNDPKELIPGDVGKLTGLATTLTSWSEKFEGIANGLRDLKIPGWKGEASDAFWPTLSKEKANWHLASDAMSGAAAAVTSYSSTLGWAQQQASTAIEQWKAGQHDTAEETLKAARNQLKPETEKLVKKLGDLAGGAAGSPGWLADARDWVDARQWATDHGVGKTSQSRSIWEDGKWREGDGRFRHRQKEWGKGEDGSWFIRDKSSDSGDQDTSGNKANVNIKLAEWTGDASAWSFGTGPGETTVGGAKLKGQAGIDLLGVSGTAGASIKDGQLQAGLSGSAYLAQASAKGSAEYGIAAVQGEAKAYVGADASATVGVGKDGVHAGAEAFAGAKATGSVSADVGGVGAGVTGEAWAGVGASASADLGMKDGKFTIGGELGAGLGVGGKVSFDVTIDAGKMIDSVGDAADAVGSGAKSAWDHTLGALF